MEEKSRPENKEINQIQKPRMVKMKEMNRVKKWKKTQNQTQMKKKTKNKLKIMQKNQTQKM